MRRLLLCFLISVCLSTAGIGCLKKDSDGSDANKQFKIDRDAILFEARKNGLIMDFDEVARMSQTVPVEDQTGHVPDSVEDFFSQTLSEWDSAALADVTGGGSYGIARVKKQNGVYTLVAEVGNLPQLAEGNFYNGWLVQRGEEMKLLGTGKLIATQKGHANVYISSMDLSEFSFYVVTLEEGEEDTFAGEHILEGGFDY